MTNEGTPKGLARSLELLWDARDRPSRGPKPGLTLDLIVETAIEVADAEGTTGLSMRKVAVELGVGTMSLYRYVPGKQELLDLMLDHISAPSEKMREATASGWRATCEAIARDTYDVYVDHPWLLQINWSRPVLGPNTIASMEVFVTGTVELGLTDPEKIMVLSVIDSYCVGSARGRVQYTAAAEETGISDEEFWALQVPVLEKAMLSGDYPMTASLAEDSFDADWEATFEFGLRVLLDGLEGYVAGSRPD